MKYAFFDKYGDVISYGEKDEAARKAFNFRFDVNRVLIVKVKGFYESKFHSYGLEYSEEEMNRCAVDFLINSCGYYWGITCLKQF